jgi:hypothetical protein
MKVAAVRTLQAMTLIALLSAPLSHAQFMTQACAPINNISWRDQGELQAIPVIWSPGHTYTVSLIGAFSITSLLGSDCPDIAVSEWEWPDYPNYDEIGPPAQYIHLSNLTYVSSTLTTFTASVDGGAPFGYVELMLKSSSEGYAFWGVAIEPPAPPTPPSPPLPPPPPPPPAPCPTPAFAPVSPNTPVSPSVWFAGKTYPIVITGTGFTTPANATDSCPATQITVSVDTGSVALSDVTVLNSTTITATAEPADTDPAETAEVNLWGPGGGGIVLDARTAGNAKQAASSARAMASSPPVGPDGMNYDGQAPAKITQKPTITSVSPSKIYVGKDDVEVTISGSGFGTSPTVNLPPGVTSSGQTSSNSQISITLSVGYVKPTSSAKVTVTNSDNGLTSNSFTITLNGPASAKVKSDRIIGQNLDGAMVRKTTYQVYNVDNSAAGSIPIAEDYTTSGWSCTNASQPVTLTTVCDGQSSTGSNGQFSDYWSDWGTFYTPDNCGDNVTDHWQWCSPSGPTPGITFMTLSGWVHTLSSNINGFVNPPTQIPTGTVFKP